MLPQLNDWKADVLGWLAGQIQFLNSFSFLKSPFPLKLQKCTCGIKKIMFTCVSHKRIYFFRYFHYMSYWSLCSVANQESSKSGFQISWGSCGDKQTVVFIAQRWWIFKDQLVKQASFRFLDGWLFIQGRPFVLFSCSSSDLLSSSFFLQSV